jgi:hypothetical protein
MPHFKKYYFNIFTSKNYFEKKISTTLKLDYLRSVIENKLENTFQYLIGYVMEKELKNNLLMF